uniref:Uncharacterized protein n=2 Tax=Physcomitrium patens TaxID=3218 RepID=A0A7I4FJI3_PHYPA
MSKGGRGIIRFSTKVEATTPSNASVEAHCKSNLELEVVLKNFTRRCRHISRLYTIGNSTLGLLLKVIIEPHRSVGARCLTRFRSELIVPIVCGCRGHWKFQTNLESLSLNLHIRMWETSMETSLLGERWCFCFRIGSAITIKRIPRPLIVDKIHLHLFPSRNSDGFAVAKPGPTRNNAHNVYLNRDFPDQIFRVWNDHRKSMPELVAATVTSGVHGCVMSLKEGRPVAATNDITGVSHSMKASTRFGDYYRLLVRGQVYGVTASAPVYYNRTTSIFLPNHVPVTLDFILDPLATTVDAALIRGHGLFDKGKPRTTISPAPQEKCFGKGTV